MAKIKGKNLQVLNQIHLEMKELFEKHQISLLKGEFNQAIKLLNQLGKALMNHMKQEDEFLLPLFRQRAADIPGGDTEDFSTDHKKIREWFNRITLRSSRLSAIDINWKEVISLFDDEAQFKKFMQQHSTRENRILYPEMDRLVDEKEKERLCGILTFSIQDTPGLSSKAEV